MTKVIYDGPSSKPHDSGVAVAIIIAKNGKVLLMKRAGSIGTGTWAIPGGRVEFMEDPADSAIRELKEETNLNANLFDLVGYSNDTHRSENLHYVTFTLLATKWTGKPKIMEPDKCSEIGWFSIDNLPSPIFKPTEDKLAPKEIRMRIRNS